MHHATRPALWLLLVLALLPELAAAAKISAVRWSTGLRLDFSTAISYRMTQSTHPARLNLDIRDAAPPARLNQPPGNHPVAKRIVAAASRSGLHLGIDLKAPATAKVHLENLDHGVRLVVRWSGIPNAHPAKARNSPPYIVAIDAGHGGKDTGAIGPGGVREKDVALAVAHRLAGFIRAEPGLRAVLVRKGDRYISLRQRQAFARQVRADLFVSLHADAYGNGAVRGATVFTRSGQGGGAAGRVLRELKRDVRVHHHAVQKAGFMVLKAQEIPSMLVELAFISNPEEERKLKNPRHQDRLARAVFKGIRAYFARRRPIPAALRLAQAG